ncbi:hypothetical protein TcasGA2_TC034631 [Tribolium castaneum]|uniref:Uncharacterized protein n=1 Tax=Tribolium castaneum TaxID=7070 RepID=A0A139WK22_TRICA|nr:hypothetical protein TcasGA2_TC034631 [Tribolium castaneum]
MEWRSWRCAACPSFVQLEVLTKTDAGVDGRGEKRLYTHDLHATGRSSGLNLSILPMSCEVGSESGFW